MDTPNAPTPEQRAARRKLRLFLGAILLLPVIAVVLVLLSTLFNWELPIGRKEGKPVPQQEAGKY